MVHAPSQQELCNGGVDCAAFRQRVLSSRLARWVRTPCGNSNNSGSLGLWFGKVPEKAAREGRFAGEHVLAAQRELIRLEVCDFQTFSKIHSGPGYTA